MKMCDFGISGYLVDSVAKTMDAGCKPYMAVSGPCHPKSWAPAEGQRGCAWGVTVSSCPLSIRVGPSPRPCISCHRGAACCPHSPSYPCC